MITYLLLLIISGKSWSVVQIGSNWITRALAHLANQNNPMNEALLKQVLNNKDNMIANLRDMQVPLAQGSSLICIFDSFYSISSLNTIELALIRIVFSRWF